MSILVSMATVMEPVSPICEPNTVASAAITTRVPDRSDCMVAMRSELVPISFLGTELFQLLS